MPSPGHNARLQHADVSWLHQMDPQALETRETQIPHKMLPHSQVDSVNLSSFGPRPLYMAPRSQAEGLSQGPPRTGSPTPDVSSTHENGASKETTATGLTTVPTIPKRDELYYRPFILSNAALISSITVNCGILAGLIVFEKRTYFVVSTPAYYALLALLILIGTCTVAHLEAVLLSLFRMMPFILCARKQGATAGETILRSYFPAPSFRVAWGTKNWLLILAYTINIPSYSIIGFKSALLYKSWDDADVRLHVNDWACYTLITFYSVIQLYLIIVIIYLWQRKTGLRWDPVAIADILVLFRHSNALKHFEGSSIAKRESMFENLEKIRIYLKYWEAENGKCWHGFGTDDTKASNSNPNGDPRIVQSTIELRNLTGNGSDHPNQSLNASRTNPPMLLLEFRLVRIMFWELLQRLFPTLIGSSIIVYSRAHGDRCAVCFSMPLFVVVIVGLASCAGLVFFELIQASVFRRTPRGYLSIADIISWSSTSRLLHREADSKKSGESKFDIDDPLDMDVHGEKGKRWYMQSRLELQLKQYRLGYAKVPGQEYHAFGITDEPPENLPEVRSTGLARRLKLIPQTTEESGFPSELDIVMRNRFKTFEIVPLKSEHTNIPLDNGRTVQPQIGNEPEQTGEDP
ncbi:phosphoribosylaminoimidazole-succinocarboxamide synthase [Colletotrichum nymphaeae SA-01]|uniref:Phosphoribosylaminoimidazole-succinocarboxamide synthase n=1 Tax=Colletotrichum nymphaeae SA-01 TaxID=1460502 RepID=A0A135T3Q6_9PEZI|nr:phosphoribosylaminoimidazole-succinocarboxamide synthase [Colletotrichum nymphaeae SA-01]